MEAIIFETHGDVNVLKLQECPKPTPRSDEVVVKVSAVALNHLDVWVRRGWEGIKVSLPHILGSDVAGTVDAVGSGVTDVSLAEEILVSPGLSCGHCQACLTGEDTLCLSYKILGEHVNGGYAQYLVVPRRNLVPKPANLSMNEAACLPLTYLTAWTMLLRRAQLRAGETVLIHAAGSGVGCAAIQIAKLLGATVIATASTDDKLERARSLGADQTINYATTDFLKEVKMLTQRKLVDVVFEHLGASTFEKSIACLKNGGRLVTCGATTGHEIKLDLRVLFYKQLSLLGSTMGSKGDLFRIVELARQGKLKPVVDRALPLKRAAEGLRILEDRAQFGNVVLNP